MTEETTTAAVDTLEWATIADNMKSFEGFEFERVLQFQPQSNVMFVLGKLKGQPAIATLKWQGLTEGTASAVLSGDTQLTPTLRNDIYTTFVARPPPTVCAMDATLVWPATDKHIAKYEAQDYYVLRETATMYEGLVKPYLDSLPEERLAWVYNILEGKQEADRIVVRDDDPITGFVLVPDMKWNMKDTGAMYCTAIVIPRGLRSLRDLTAAHVPLLQNVRDKSLDAIQKAYGVAANRIRVFLHYHPSYYHLHIHFCHVSLGQAGVWTGMAHLVDEVIANLDLDTDYYRRATITCVLGEKHPVRLLANAAAPDGSNMANTD